MGLRSVHQHMFKELHYIGFYSPRQNVVYRIHVNHIPADIIKEIDTKVIGYDFWPCTTDVTQLHNLNRLYQTERGLFIAWATHPQNEPKFTHLGAIAQSALDAGFNQATRDDNTIAACLLHDIIEDVPFINFAYIQKEFNDTIAQIVLNVTKRDGEPYDLYVRRWTSLEQSAIVKTLDRLHNNMTMANSSLKHRQKQLEETTEVFIPVLTELRRLYAMNAPFFHQSKLIMQALMAEVERSIHSEIALEELKKNAQ